MIENVRQRGVLLAVVGFVGVVAVPHLLVGTLLDDYVYVVDDDPIEDVNATDESVIAYDSMSPPAQDAFKAALQDYDGRVGVTGTRYDDPGFEYATDHGQVYYVEYRGQYYEFRPQTVPGSAAISILLPAGLVSLMVGPIVGGVGVLRSRHWLRTFTTGVTGLVSYFLTLLVTTTALILLATVATLPLSRTGATVVTFGICAAVTLRVANGVYGRLEAYSRRTGSNWW